MQTSYCKLQWILWQLFYGPKTNSNNALHATSYLKNAHLSIITQQGNHWYPSNFHTNKTYLHQRGSVPRHGLQQPQNAMSLTKKYIWCWWLVPSKSQFPEYVFILAKIVTAPPLSNYQS
jgi:hypothetical protein